MQRQTMQKRLIWETVCEMCHPSAEAVFERLRAKQAPVSRATVFRVLNQMADKGELIRIQMPSGADCFDIVKAPHSHARCRECGAISDIMLSEIPDALDAEAQKQTDFEIIGHTLIFEGICPACRAKSVVGSKQN